MPIPSGNREGRSYARVTAVPSRGPQGWESVAPSRLTAGFDRGVRFMGYRADQRTVRAGDDLPVTTMWWLSGAAPSGPIVSLRLVDSAGKVTRSVGPERPLPTMPPGDWVLIRRDLLGIDGRLEAGQYSLEVRSRTRTAVRCAGLTGRASRCQLAPVRISGR